MRAKNMKEIVKHEVKCAWESLCLYSEVYGADYDITVRARVKWVTLDNLWDKLFPYEEY